MAIPKDTIYQLGGIDTGEIIDYSGVEELIDLGIVIAGCVFLTGGAFLFLTLGWQLLQAQ